MIELLTRIFELRKEFLISFSLTVLYIAYYLREAVKRPEVVCGAGPLRALLEREVPAARERYWPTPWCVEARLQTVLGSMLRTRFLPRPRFRRELLRLADGGQVALDWAGRGEPDPRAPVLLVLPGLTGGSHADYVRCLAAVADDLGAALVVFTNRGLGGVPLTTPRLYCAVSHDDLAEVVAAVWERRPEARALFAVGVSLGGLILGQYLAAHGERARVHAALAVSAPLDVVKGTESIERPPLNAVMSWACARALRRTVAAHSLLLRTVDCDWNGVARSRSVRQFDTAFTARHFGFASVDAYYEAATLRGKLGAVAAPLVCLCAADDPFQPRAALPAAEAGRSALVALVVTARGGHIGFLSGWWPAADARAQLLSRLAAQYFAALLRHPALLHRVPRESPTYPQSKP